MSKGEQQLERFVTRLAASQPPRQAPRSLERRVFAELERRAVLPWWRKPFTLWPLAARVAFLAASPIFVKLALLGATDILGGASFSRVSAAVLAELSWMRMWGGLISALGEAAALAIRHPPAYLLYGGFAVAALYAALFGIGAAAYRTLYNSR